MECKFEIAAGTSSVSFDLFLRIGVDAMRGPREEHLLTIRGGHLGANEPTVALKCFFWL